MRETNVFTTSIPTGEAVRAHGLVLKFFRVDAADHALGGDALAWYFIDWIVPNRSGLEICRRLRSDPRTEQARIVMVLERADLEDERRAIAAGADDYVIGPLSHEMIRECLLAAQPSALGGQPGRLDFGSLVFDLRALDARWNGTPIPLTRQEFRLLRFLAQNPRRVLTREQMIGSLGKQEPQIDPRTVDVWMGRLRRALRKVGAGKLIRTVRSAGYVFDLEELPGERDLSSRVPAAPALSPATVLWSDGDAMRRA